MIHACVDIGSNTTRLLVAEVDDEGVWRELMTQRAYTLIGKQAGENGRLRKKTIANTVEVVATQVRLAAEMGAGDITIVATAAVRGAPNRDDLTTAITAETGLPVRVLTGSEEAHLDKAVAVGGTATSLKKLVGNELDHETLERGIRILAESSVAEVQERFDVKPERAHLLPAGMLILEELSDLVGLPFQIGNGGLREGVILSGMAARQEAA